MELPIYSRAGGDVEALSRTEWLLTNGLGGFAMGTAAGVPTRRYHGLLAASLRPPVNRVMALSAVAETVTFASGLKDRPPEAYELSSFRFQPGVIHPAGHQYLREFTKDVSAHWRFEVAGITVRKTVHLVRGQPAVLIRYRVESVAPVKLSVRPLVALRDFHALQLRDLARGKFRCESAVGGVTVHGGAGIGSVTIKSDGAFAAEEVWWHNFQYDMERDRGYDYLEDLFSPGVFAFDIPAGGGEVTIRAALGEPPTLSVVEAEQRERKRLAAVMDATRMTLGPAFSPRGPLAGAPVLKQLPALISAADDFVVRRVRPGSLPGAAADRVSIIAGYPWFADWGRDSMIALPGLLLTCGRLTEAREVLLTFAGACKDGLIPNVFDDYTGAAHYNTVDAPLWFIHASCQYLAESGDAKAFERDLLPACAEIVTGYEKGTHFGIKMDDADGLIRAGHAGTQLTWMDAARDGVVFTPRNGKPVEINALWYNALCALGVAAEGANPALAIHCRELAPKVGRSIRGRFWNERRKCLYDVLGPGDNGVEEVRPNQIFAVSLPYSALEQGQQAAVVETVRRMLWTAHGVRTLEREDWRYKGRYRGRMFDRDAAYHNGTAWPWLMGPLAEGVCRAGAFSPAAVAEAKTVLAGLVASLDAGCCGQIAEVYDGDDTEQDPQQAGGCPAQAWSVAELLRVQVMIARAEAKH